MPVRRMVSYSSLAIEPAAPVLRQRSEESKAQASYLEQSETSKYKHPHTRAQTDESSLNIWRIGAAPAVGRSANTQCARITYSIFTTRLRPSGPRKNCCQLVPEQHWRPQSKSHLRGFIRFVLSSTSALVIVWLPSTSSLPNARLTTSDFI